jgi:hypothetical protein
VEKWLSIPGRTSPRPLRISPVSIHELGSLGYAEHLFVLLVTVNYGARLPPDPTLLDEIIDVEDGLSRIKTPLGSFQDFIPILRYLPFNKKSETAKEINRRRLIFLNRFAREMEDRVEKGVDKPCIQGNCLRDPQVKLDKTDLMGISMSMVPDIRYHHLIDNQD